MLWVLIRSTSWRTSCRYPLLLGAMFKSWLFKEMLVELGPDLFNLQEYSGETVLEHFGHCSRESSRGKYLGYLQSLRACYRGA